MIGIYKIVSPSGKVYIGQSWNIEKRFKQYRTLSSIKSQKLLYRSIRKYGYDAHHFSVLSVLNKNCTQSNLDNAEVYYIAKEKESKSLLNLTSGGLGGKGTKREKRISKEVLYNLYIVENRTKIEIANTLNQKERLIKKYLTEYGIRKEHNAKILKDREIGKNSATILYGEQILEMRKQGLSYKEILKLLPITNAVISNTIRKFKK